MMAKIDVATQKVQAILELPGAKGAYANADHLIQVSPPGNKSMSKE
jgi:hypothetical protein